MLEGWFEQGGLGQGIGQPVGISSESMIITDEVADGIGSLYNNRFSYRLTNPVFIALQDFIEVCFAKGFGVTL